MRKLKMMLCVMMLPLVVDTAERDYFTLRERLVMMQAQLEGAQQYITEQCLK